MPTLSIDISNARWLQHELARWAATAEDAGRLAVEATLLSDLATSVPVRLDWVERCARGAATAVGTAIELAETFVLPPLTPGPTTPSTPWNHARQVADHNTYAHGTVASHRAHGRHAHEFDLHLGAPTDLSGDGPHAPWFGLAQVAVDAATPDAVIVGDWHVYHTSFDPDSSYQTLGAALDDVANTSSVAPVTIFLDLKDPLRGDHEPAVLDALLRERLGARLWTPADLAARSPGAATLQHAIAQEGWPAVDDLVGRVMVVVTDHVGEYHDRSAVDSVAFVAMAPDLDALADPDVVIYNEHVRRITSSQIEVIRTTGGMLRVWGASSPDESATTRAANWVAVD